jgi:ubiquinone/menaquinone biosynthesis C-methylase UbiE
MLELASRKLRGRDIELVQADASDLPVESERFDVSCVSFALHEMPAGVRERVVRELARVTRRGGTVVIVDHALPRNRVWRWFVYHVVKAFEPATYVDFAHQDLAALLARSGIALRTTYRVGFGAVRILIGIREG